MHSRQSRRYTARSIVYLLIPVIKKIWFFEITCFLFCVLVVSSSPMFNRLFVTTGSHFRSSDQKDFGANLLYFVPPDGYRFQNLSFPNPSGYDKIFEFFFNVEGAVLGVSFESGSIKITMIHAGDHSVVAQLPRNPGQYRLAIEDYRLFLQRDNDTLYVSDSMISNSYPLFLRVGPRMYSFISLPPANIHFTVKALNSPYQERVIHATPWVRRVILVGLGTLIFATLLVVSLIPSTLTASPKIIMAVQLLFLTCLMIIPFASSKKLYDSHILRNPAKQIDIACDSAKKTGVFNNNTITTRLNPEERVILLIGGSAAAGKPYLTKNVATYFNEMALQTVARPTRIVNVSISSSTIDDWLPQLDSLVSCIQPNEVLLYANFNTFFFRTSHVPSSMILATVYYINSDWLPPEVLFNMNKVPDVLGLYDQMAEFLVSRGVTMYVIDDPVGSWFPNHESYERFRIALNAHLKERDITVIPMHNDFAGDDYRHLFYDVCHLTRYGYMQEARLLMKYLGSASGTPTGPPRPAADPQGPAGPTPAPGLR